MHHHHTIVRSQRKRHRLSQAELARLLGLSQAQVSRLETPGSVPEFSTVLALQVIFGHTPRYLFPQLYGLIEDRTMANAAQLDQQLGGKQDYDSQSKRRLLIGMAQRAGYNAPSP